MIAGTKAAVMALVLSIAWQPVAAQGQEYRAPRTADGKPDLNGIWQALGSAHWNIEPHAAGFGPVVELAALGAIPGGLGIIEGGEIPYRPEARVTQQENLEHWLESDPAVKCYMPGVPRATYMPMPFQIIQSETDVFIAYQFAGAVRDIYMDNPGPSQVDSWMGWSVGSWEGDTLVVDVTGLLDGTWFDRAGSHHSTQLHVVERYTMISPNHIDYEAIIEDPVVLTEPFTIKMPIYRRIEENARLMDFRCVEFVEELLFGEWRRTPLPR